MKKFPSQSPGWPAINVGNTDGGNFNNYNYAQTHDMSVHPSNNF